MSDLVSGDLRFDLDKPLIGDPPGVVILTSFGELRVEHRLLEVPIVVSLDRVAGVFALGDEEEPGPVFELAALALPGGMTRAPTVSIVLRAPVRVGPFTGSATRVLPINRRQRKEGVDIDVLLLPVADPGLLVKAVRALVPSLEPNLVGALSIAAPPVAPELAAEISESRRRRTRRTARTQVLVGTAVAALASLRVAATSMTWETTARLCAATVAASWLVALLLAAAPRSTDHSPRHARRRVLVLLGVLGATLLVLAVLGSSHRLYGAPYILAWSAAIAAVAGPAIGVGLRVMATSRPQSITPSPMVRAGGRRWGAGVATALAAGAVVAVMASTEQTAAALVRAVQSALLDTEDLPDRWLPCCGGDTFDRGDGLDVHICGGDDDELRAHVAAAKRSFVKPNGGDLDYLQARLDISVRLAPSIADAKAEFAAVDSEGYVDCTTESVRTFVAGVLGEKATGRPHVVYFYRRPVGDGSDAVIDYFNVRTPVNDQFNDSSVQFVRMRVGRAIVRMPVVKIYQGPVDDTELDAIIAAARAEVEAASPAWD